jgi:hypothetical protein
MYVCCKLDDPLALCPQTSPQEEERMRRVLFICSTGVLVGGCAGPDLIRPSDEVPPVATAAFSHGPSAPAANPSPAVILDDAIDRLVPALGPAGVALGAPLRQVRDAGRLDGAVIDAIQRQLAALQSALAPERAPDAEALSSVLSALRAIAGT